MRVCNSVLHWFSSWCFDVIDEVRKRLYGWLGRPVLRCSCWDLV